MPLIIQNLYYIGSRLRYYLKVAPSMPREDAVKLRIKLVHEIIEKYRLDYTPIPEDQVNALPPCILVANHSSLLDALLVYGTFGGNIRILAKASLFSLPALGTILKLDKHIPVRRGKNAADRNSMLRQAIHEELEAGNSIFIFPEGTRTRTGALGPFKLGAFFNAIQNNVPIVPVIIRGTFESLPRTSFRIRPGKCSMELLDPIMPSEAAVATDGGASGEADGGEKAWAQRLADLVRGKMQERLGEPRG